MMDNGYSYGAINSAKSALSLITEIDSKDSLILKQFMKEVFNTNPPKPKYKAVWNVSIVLTYIKQLGSNDTMTLKQFTLKLTMLCYLH